MKYSNLFKPGKIGGLELKNRTIMLPMLTSASGLLGEVSDDIIEWYARRAEGGAGLIVVEVCMTATAAEASDAHGGPDGLGIWRHNGTDWVKLNSTVSFDAAAQTYKVCANSSRFSPFALGLDVAPPEAGEVATGLPATGDYSPNALTIVMAMLAGFALVGTGVVTARRSRRVREDS